MSRILVEVFADHSSLFFHREMDRSEQMTQTTEKSIEIYRNVWSLCMLYWESSAEAMDSADPVEDLRAVIRRLPGGRVALFAGGVKLRLRFRSAQSWAQDAQEKRWNKMLLLEY